MKRLNQMTTALIAGAIVLTFAHVTLAGPGHEHHGKHGKQWKPSFEAFDADGDGQITLEEFTTAAAARAAQRFERLDADGDGVVTPEEMEAARQKYRGYRGKSDKPES